MPVVVGTSGWQYDHWKGLLYPAGLPQRLWLERHAEQWGSVEVNNAFYRLPRREVFEAWAARTPGRGRARHASWWVPELRDVLRAHGAALVWADRSSEPVAPLWRTADWGYLRLHAGGGDAVWPYDDAVLDRWAGQLTETWDDTETVYAYTDNDPGGAGCATVPGWPPSCAVAAARSDGPRPTRADPSTDLAVRTRPAPPWSYPHLDGRDNLA